MKQNSTIRYVEQQIWKQRIDHGVSDSAYNPIWQMTSLYLLCFYTDVTSLSARPVAFIFVVTRFIDGGTDLPADYYIDHTRIRWRKSRPYSLFEVIPFALFAVLVFSVPDISQSGKLTCAYVTYIDLSSTYTVVNTPMAPIPPSLTIDIQEWIALSATRESLAFLGPTVVSSTALKLMDLLGKSSKVLDSRIVMIISGFIGCPLFFFTSATVKERVNTAAESISLKGSFMSLGKNKLWPISTLNIIFVWTDFFPQTGVAVYYYIAIIGSKELSATITTIMFVVPMTANSLVSTLAGHMGKCNLHASSAAIQLAGLVVVLSAGTDHRAILVGAMITALGYGMKESICSPTQVDLVDYSEWKTNVNTADLLPAINGFLGKVVQAIAGDINGIFLAQGAYQGDASAQSSDTVLTIEITHLYIPMLLPICSTITTPFYNLDRIYPRVKTVLDSRDE